MFGPCVLFSNNPVIDEKIKTKHSCRLGHVDGTSLDVLFAVRDAVHMGAKLLTHPLYGNLRPYQQPYRTILLEDGLAPCDFESLTLIENALDVYQSCANRLVKPLDLPEPVRADYGFIDFELMRESFARYGILKTI